MATTKRTIDEIAYSWTGCKITWIGEPIPWTIIAVTLAGSNELSVTVQRDGMPDRTLTISLDDEYDVVMDFKTPF
jgi:hypothetical protein